jgi:tetratricopeptide (TPR) repeat protein
MAQAGACMERGEYDPAVARYTEAIRADPNLADAYAARAWASIELGDCRGAVADLTEVLRLTPRDDSRVFRLGMPAHAYTQLGVHCRRQQSQKASHAD